MPAASCCVRCPRSPTSPTLLDEYRYFDSRLLVHTDPAYMHRDRRNWAAYNAGVRGRESEGSAWLGALQDTASSRARVHVFKSWATRRRADPKHILLERRFKHPLITRSTIKAARALRPHQGRHGLYFSGQYTTGMDLQESAVYSAMQVAESLAPAAEAGVAEPVERRGRAGISYDEPWHRGGAQAPSTFTARAMTKMTTA